tara:strand:- start:146 stop:481 length:336 start_codon:yes stop_codon:yes gene_type:complete
MLNKKIFISVIIFSIFMIFTSIIKTQTRIIEKKNTLYEKKNSKLQNELHELQLDYYYLSSPSYISQKILENSDVQYISIKYSKIFFTLDQFLKSQQNITQFYKNEKKTEKK